MVKLCILALLFVTTIIQELGSRANSRCSMMINNNSEFKDLVDIPKAYSPRTIYYQLLWGLLLAYFNLIIQHQNIPVIPSLDNVVVNN